MGNRKDPRFRTRFDALISSGPAEGTGVLTDLSYSGASIEDVTVWPRLGSRVRAYVFIQPVSPFELEGWVVRLTKTGFAIAHEHVDAELRHLVDDIGAVVSLPRSGSR